jgi:hypothetical protein
MAPARTRARLPPGVGTSSAAAAYWNSMGEDLSIFLVMLKGLKVTLPAPAPLDERPPLAVPDFFRQGRGGKRARRQAAASTRLSVSTSSADATGFRSVALAP